MRSTPKMRGSSTVGSSGGPVCRFARALREPQGSSGFMRYFGVTHTATNPAHKFPATMEVLASLFPPARSDLCISSRGELEACLRFTAAKPKFGLPISVF